MHKKLVNIVKFVGSGAELVQEMRNLWFYRFLHWFISGGCSVYVLVAKTILKALLWFSNFLKKLKIDRNISEL